MEYFIFNYNRDAHLINSFLESSALAHNEEVKSIEWFKWKFILNRYGSCLACVKDESKIVGCVSFGFVSFNMRGEIVKSALTFETFVHPEYQRRGIFRKLLSNVEAELKKNKCRILFNFPNKNSLPGYVSNGFLNNPIMSYKLKIINYRKFCLHVADLKKSFQSLPSNLLEIREYEIPVLNKNKAGCFPLFDKDYLVWRFQTHSNGHYNFIYSCDFFAIIRTGLRGVIKESQILFYIGNTSNKRFNELKNKIIQIQSPDIISVWSSKASPLMELIKRKCFINVPTRSNCCFKILDSNFNIDIEDLQFDSLIAHTY